MIILVKTHVYPELKILLKIIRNPKSLLKVLDDKSIKFRDFVIKSNNKIDRLPEISIKDLFEEFDQLIENFTYLEGGSLPIDIAFLMTLAQKYYQECSFLEIGTWRGETIFNVSKFAKDSTSISLSAEEMRELRLSEDFISLNRFFTKNNPKITNIEHNSHTIEYSSLEKKFDLIFIDGDHSFEGVKKDSILAFNLIKDNSSIIVWHDYGLTPETINYEVFAGILTGSPQDKRKNIYKVANTLCAIYINKDLPGKYCYFPKKPEIVFDINIKMRVI